MRESGFAQRKTVLIDRRRAMEYNNKKAKGADSMKKLLRLLLALVMAAGLGVGAAADDDFRLISYRLDENGVFYTEYPPIFFTPSVFEPHSFTSLIVGTIRIEFNYDDTDWRIQFHKGRYGLALIGAQMGVFTKPSDQPETNFFSATEKDYVAMQITAWQHNFSNGNTVFLFTRGHSSWWLDGLIPGSFRSNAYNHRDREIITDTTITFHSAEMAQLFANAMLDGGFSEGEPSHTNPDTLRIDENSVHFSWQHVNHSRQGTSQSPSAPPWWASLHPLVQFLLRWLAFGWIWM